MSASPRALVEFPADDPERARRFWEGLLGLDLRERTPEQGSGWQAGDDAAAVGVHARGAGPGDRFALPYFAVGDLPAALERVTALGGTLIHPGERFAVCRDSEGSPFGLSAGTPV
jgi:predicted enzyme related to lactoylglutathione lyase